MLKIKTLSDNEFDKKSILTRTRFFDPSVKEWQDFDSINKCWKYCEEKVSRCKAISFYSLERKCQFFTNDSLPEIADPQFESFTTKKGLFNFKLASLEAILFVLLKESRLFSLFQKHCLLIVIIKV